nr:hypothetical protein [Tanacetum cinerariifolium]
MDPFNDEMRAQQLYRLHELNEEYLSFVHEEDEGSSSHTRTYIPRDYEGALQRLLDDYFGDNPRYPEVNFRLRFLMSRKLFLKIVKGNKFGRVHDNGFGNRGAEISRQKQACYNYGEEDYFIHEYPKPKENKAFVGGA